MERRAIRARSALRRPRKFLVRMPTGFKRYQSYLLAGPVACYRLLSIN